MASCTSVVLVRLVKVLVVAPQLPGAALDVLPVPLEVLVLLGPQLVNLEMFSYQPLVQIHNFMLCESVLLLLQCFQISHLIHNFFKY